MKTISDATISEDGEIILNKRMTKEIKRWGKTVKVFFEGNNLIVSYHNISNGEPVIVGTRIAVRTVVEYSKLYGGVEKILTALPHLNAKQVREALGYYSTHKEEIDSYIAENDEVYQEKQYQTWQKR